MIANGPVPGLGGNNILFTTSTPSLSTSLLMSRLTQYQGLLWWFLLIIVVAIVIVAYLYNLSRTVVSGGRRGKKVVGG
jgi:hypothetical protein